MLYESMRRYRRHIRDFNTVVSTVKKKWCCSVCQHLTQSCSSHWHPCFFSAVTGQRERRTNVEDEDRRSPDAGRQRDSPFIHNWRFQMASPCTCLPMCSAWREGNHVFSCFVFELYIRVLLIYGFMDFQLRRTRLFWDFPLGRSYSAELTNMKVSKGDGLWEVSEKRWININQFMFKGVINDKLNLVWTEQVLSFPQPSFRNVPDEFQCFLYEYSVKLYWAQFTWKGGVFCCA